MPLNPPAPSLPPPHTQEVPAEVPEPALGINFARDGMQKKDWLGLVAVHSDAWLMALAFYKGARMDSEERCAEEGWGRGEGKACGSLPQVALSECRPVGDPTAPSSLRAMPSPPRCPPYPREELFMLINKLPTVYEIISGRVKAPPLGAARKPAVPKPPRPPSVREGAGVCVGWLGGGETPGPRGGSWEREGVTAEARGTHPIFWGVLLLVLW